MMFSIVCDSCPHTPPLSFFFLVFFPLFACCYYMLYDLLSRWHGFTKSLRKIFERQHVHTPKRKTHREKKGEQRISERQPYRLPRDFECFNILILTNPKTLGIVFCILCGRIFFFLFFFFWLCIATLAQSLAQSKT